MPGCMRYIACCCCCCCCIAIICGCICICICICGLTWYAAVGFIVMAGTAEGTVPGAARLSNGSKDLLSSVLTGVSCSGGDGTGGAAVCVPSEIAGADCADEFMKLNPLAGAASGSAFLGASVKVISENISVVEGVSNKLFSCFCWSCCVSFSAAPEDCFSV